MTFEEKIYKLLNEASAGGSVGGFVGRKGQDIDDLFSGPFYPSIEAKGVLKDQVQRNEDNIKFSEELTPLQEVEMMLVEMEYVFDEYPEYADKLIFINDTEDMKEVDLEIQYDDPDCGCDKSIFINDTNDYKLVGE